MTLQSNIKLLFLACALFFIPTVCYSQVVPANQQKCLLSEGYAEFTCHPGISTSSLISSFPAGMNQQSLAKLKRDKAAFDAKVNASRQSFASGISGVASQGATGGSEIAAQASNTGAQINNVLIDSCKSQARRCENLCGPLKMTSAINSCTHDAAQMDAMIIQNGINQQAAQSALQSANATNANATNANAANTTTRTPASNGSFQTAQIVDVERYTGGDPGPGTYGVTPVGSFRGPLNMTGKGTQIRMPDGSIHTIGESAWITERSP